MKFRIDLDDFCEEIFHEMERISVSGNGHECVIDVEGDKLIAAETITGLLIPFVKSKIEEVK